MAKVCRDQLLRFICLPGFVPILQILQSWHVLGCPKPAHLRLHKDPWMEECSIQQFGQSFLGDDVTHDAIVCLFARLMTGIKYLAHLGQV